jgi:hypothetical protein
MLYTDIDGSINQTQRYFYVFISNVFGESSGTRIPFILLVVL